MFEESVLWDYTEPTIIQHTAAVRFGPYFINMPLVLLLFDCNNYDNLRSAFILLPLPRIVEDASPPTGATSEINIPFGMK